uniref:Uncharacterized protein n=1 Tax=Timema shepardi TaxID=629360 RepID=A0A7R9ANR8_TIMSH|nr:unnamed protein product [Timema shepardi]
MASLVLTDSSQLTSDSQHLDHDRVRSFGDDMGELEGLKVTPPSSPNNKPEDIIASTSQSPNSEMNTVPLGTNSSPMASLVLSESFKTLPDQIIIESKHEVTILGGLNEFCVKFYGPRGSKYSHYSISALGKLWSAGRIATYFYVPKCKL